MYEPLIALMARHAQCLTQRAHSSSLPPADEVAMAVVPELTIIVEILQGLCLLSRRSKEAIGEAWVLEVS